jgi:hypothetical protein
LGVKEAKMVYTKIPKNLPYWKYAQYKSKVRYWKYKLGENADYGRLKVFKGRDGLRRLWFLTDYVVPCDEDGNFFTVSEVTNPNCETKLAIVVIRKEQGGPVTMDLLFDDFSLADPIILTADEISISKGTRMHRPVIFTNALQDMLVDKYREYIEATERWMMEG